MGHAGLGNELLSRGYSKEVLSFNGGHTQYLSTDGKVVITKTIYYDYPFISGVTKTISRDKELSYAFVQQLGVKIPATIRTTDIDKASQFLSTYQRVVVKPADLGGGQGLTLDITDVNQLKEAIEHATFNGSAPLLQRQFIGEEVRFTVVGGKVHSAILRSTPRVVGDGQKTVAELIKLENEARVSLVFPLLSYPQLTAEIIPEHFFKDERVLAESEVLELSKSTMISKGASFYGIMEDIHPSYIKIAELLASRLNPPFLVVDLMIEDWQSEASPDNYIFLEFNTAPALSVYTSLRAGNQPDIIAKLADMVEKYSDLAS